MSLAIYMDEHIPDAITQGLRARGVDVLTVAENGQDHTDDSVILDTALTLGRVVFTCDKDFLRIAEHRQAAGDPFAGVIYLPQRKLAAGPCIAHLEVYAKAGEPDDLMDQVVYLKL